MILLCKSLLEEDLNVGRVQLRLLLRERHRGEERARVDLQVIVEDDDWALLLKRPDLGVELGVLDLEQLLVHRVVCQQGHVVGWSLNDARGI